MSTTGYPAPTTASIARYAGRSSDAPSTPLRGLLPGLAAAAVGLGQGAAATQQRQLLDVPGTIRQAFGPGWPFALCVATAESGLNPHAVGAELEVSIWQLHPRGWLPGYYAWSEVDDVTDVEDTSRYVAQRVAQDGWGAFTTAGGCE